jgi:hypothetical protein
MKTVKRTNLLVCAAALTLALGLATSTAEAAVTREGAWPSEDPKVSLSLGRTTRGEALRELAEEAEWSLAFEEIHELNAHVVIELKDVPASTALDAILGSGAWTAKREGSLVSIALRAEGARGTGPTPPAPPAPPAPPSPPEPPSLAVATRKESGARDISVTGESVKIAAGDTVRDVTVMGGEAEIAGHVTGDLAVIGGSARIHDGARIDGDANAIGGSITIDEGGRVDGEVSVIGGIVRGAEHARGRGVKIVAGGDRDDEKEEAQLGLFARASRAVSSAVSSAALLFVFGSVLIALAGDRFDHLRGEIAARPMKSIAMGLVGGIGTILALIVLAVTVIGIPFSAVGAVLFLFAIFAGTAAAATTAGAAIAGHRFKSPYGHLAVGCAIYLVAGLLPWIGGWLQIAMLLAGYGAIVSTRAAGLIRRKTPSLPPTMAPYR